MENNYLLYDLYSLINAFFDYYYQHGKIDIASKQVVINEKINIKNKLESASIAEQVIYIDKQKEKYISDYSKNWYFNFGLIRFSEKLLTANLIDNLKSEPLISEAEKAIPVLLGMVNAGKITISLNHDIFGSSTLSYSEITELLSGEVGIIDFAKDMYTIEYYGNNITEEFLSTKDISINIEITDTFSLDGFVKELTGIAFKELEKYWNDIIKEMRVFVEKIQISSRPAFHKKETKLSYQWQGSAGELSELYQRLIANKLIANNTSEADFKAIFEAKPLNEIKPIRWIQKPVLLAYFIEKLRDKIPFNDNIWKIAESCFQPAKHLKQSAANYQNNKSELPKNHHLVDMLFQ